jgi:GT2 family glycosyltransferase
MKIWVNEIDLGQLKSIRIPAGFAKARLLVRAQGRPLGWMELTASVPERAQSLEEIRKAVLEQLPVEVARERFRQAFLDQDSTHGTAAPISVVVCTRDRPDQLRICLQRLVKLDYPNFEIIVVDNAPTGSGTHTVAHEFPVRYVTESRPGLDWARNRGVAEALHDLVAFTDDDVCVDRGWLKAINRAFQDRAVAGLTGLVLPFSLETSAQRYFEQTYGGMGKGFEARTLHRDQLTPEGMLWASGFGVGANMAFRRSVLEQLDGFDVALDVGTAARGGGDVEFFHRLVAHGYVLRYEPEAIVWHTHRADHLSLKRQLFNNGCSVVPYLLSCSRRRTVPLIHIVSYAIRDVLGWWLLRRLIRPGNHRRSLTLEELAGFFWGFTAYPRARLAAARLAKEPAPTLTKTLIPKPRLKPVTHLSTDVADK